MKIRVRLWRNCLIVWAPASFLHNDIHNDIHAHGSPVPKTSSVQLIVLLQQMGLHSFHCQHME